MRPRFALARADRAHTARTARARATLVLLSAAAFVLLAWPAPTAYAWTDDPLAAPGRVWTYLGAGLHQFGAPAQSNYSSKFVPASQLWRHFDWTQPNAHGTMLTVAAGNSGANGQTQTLTAFGTHSMDTTAAWSGAPASGAYALFVQWARTTGESRGTVGGPLGTYFYLPNTSIPTTPSATMITRIDQSYSGTYLYVTRKRPDGAWDATLTVGAWQRTWRTPNAVPPPAFQLPSLDQFQVSPVGMSPLENQDLHATVSWWEQAGSTTDTATVVALGGIADPATIPTTTADPPGSTVDTATLPPWLPSQVGDAIEGGKNWVKGMVDSITAQFQGFFWWLGGLA